MNDDVKGGLILFGSTLTAGFLVATLWTAPITTSESLFGTGLVVVMWTVVNLLAVP